MSPTLGCSSTLRPTSPFSWRNLEGRHGVVKRAPSSLARRTRLPAPRFARLSTRYFGLTPTCYRASFRPTRGVTQDDTPGEGAGGFITLHIVSGLIRAGTDVVETTSGDEMADAVSGAADGTRDKGNSASEGVTKNTMRFFQTSRLVSRPPKGGTTNPASSREECVCSTGFSRNEWAATRIMKAAPIRIFLALGSSMSLAMTASATVPVATNVVASKAVTGKLVHIYYDVFDAEGTCSRSASRFPTPAARPPTSLPPTSSATTATTLNPGVNDAAGNADGDALTNLQEYNAGTDPQVSNSVGPSFALSGRFTVYTIVDLDGDGIHDAWEVFYFGSPAACDPMADNDGDRMRNYQEFIAGTDPLHASSLLLIASQEQGQPAGLTVKWLSASNKLYVIERATNLISGFSTALATGVSSTPPLNSYTDATATNAGPFFYRIRVTAP